MNMALLTAMRAMRVLIFISLFVQCVMANGDESVKTHYVEKVDSYELGEYETETVKESAVDCCAECLRTECVAYQWTPASRTCRTQSTLNVTSTEGNPESAVSLILEYTHQDCSEILAADATAQTGVYYIRVSRDLIKPVWCDMDTEGGGWTLFLHRFDGSVDFYRDLVDYEAGFGAADGEYWLGLEAIHALTASKVYEFRADVSDWEGVSAHSAYASIAVAEKATYYKLSLGAFLGGDAGDSFALNNGRKFSSRDDDQDGCSTCSCAQKHHGGFWFKICSKVFPTSRYYPGGVCTPNPEGGYDGMQWKTWPAHPTQTYSVKTVQLKIRVP